MKALMHSLKKSAGAIVIVILLLIIQAYCDLALPEYTSAIVNVGIQQSGIEDVSPDEITSDSYEKLLLFMTEDEKEKVNSSYHENGDKFTLNDDVSDETREELNTIFTIPLILKSVAENPDTFSEYQNSDESQQMALPEGMSLFDMLEKMPEEQSTETVNKMREKFSDVDGAILSQMGISLVKNEYEKVGKDLASIQSRYIVSTGAKMLGLAFAGAVCTIIVTLLASRIGASSSRDLRSGVFRKVVSFSNAEMSGFSTASLITRCTNDIQQVQLMVTMMLRMIFYAPIVGIGAYFKVMQQKTGMAWVIGLGVVILLSLVGVLFSVAMPKFKKLQDLVDRLNLVSREIITGLPVIRAFSREKHEEERFDVANKDLTKVNLFVNRVMTIMMPTMMFIMNGISVLIVWVGAGKVDIGNMQVGDLMAFISYTMQIIMAFLMISMMSVMLPRAAVSAKRIQEVIDTPISIDDTKYTKSVPFVPERKGVVEFKNVSFKYPDAKEYSLRNVTFTAHSGKTTAFIGSTGSGKSTLINLIPRFFDVTDGEIIVDGVNIKDVTQHQLREIIGYVPQKGVLFSGTIKSNIGYGVKNISDEQLKLASEISQSEEFISQKPDKYDEAISQGGTNVSGGQKQRLSIARAIAKNPEILIFDDSFSALDYKTDAKLRKALNTHISDTTVLIVAQRISTVMNADQIIVLDNGNVAGIGTHSELLKNCEVYKQIATSQLSQEELEQYTGKGEEQ